MALGSFRASELLTDFFTHSAQMALSATRLLSLLLMICAVGCKEDWRWLTKVSDDLKAGGLEESSQVHYGLKQWYKHPPLIDHCCSLHCTHPMCLQLLHHTRIVPASHECGDSVPSALSTCYHNVCSSTHPTPPTEMLEWTLWNVAIFYHRQAQHSVGDPAHEHALRAQKFYKLASANKGGNHDAVVGGAVELEQMLGRWQKKPDKLPISGTAMSFSALLL